jgi:Fe2+ transport system protein FeoA
MKCAFCDFEFDEASALRCCKGCALFGGCQKVRCPKCGYESPRETRLVRWIRSWGSRRRGNRDHAGATGPLARGHVGAAGDVVGIDTRDQAQMRKLMAMGILPGTHIQLLRRFPSFVFQVDYSQFTVDRELALSILVRWDAASNRGTK